MRRQKEREAKALMKGLAPVLSWWWGPGKVCPDCFYLFCMKQEAGLLSQSEDGNLGSNDLSFFSPVKIQG